MRPGPVPKRAARRFTDNGPVMSQSGEVASPMPATGSLLVTSMISDTGAGSQLSVARTSTLTGTSRPLGGQSWCKLGTTPMISGGSVSRRKLDTT